MCKFFTQSKATPFSLLGLLGFFVYWGFLFHSVCIRRVSTTLPVVALTFDDGPSSPFTDEILKILDSHSVKATFFFIGQNILSNPSTVRKTVKAGHEIGNHSFSHPFFRWLSLNEIKGEITRTDEIIKEWGGEKKLFRAPYGGWSFLLLLQLYKMNRKNFLFDVKSIPPDYIRTDTEAIVDSVMKQLRPGSIIELHDGEGTQAETVLAVDQIISQAMARGFHFVTLSQLESENNKSDLR